MQSVKAKLIFCHYRLVRVSAAAALQKCANKGYDAIL